MGYKNYFLLPAFLLFGLNLNAQTPDKSDTVPSRILDPVTVQGYQQHHLSDIEGINIFAGKKTDVIDLNRGEANLSRNVGRMIFAKMPGVNLWDMDGAGTQMNIGTRGTNAHRSIEMNMRQNGYNTNSDIFGYPENHYTVPMQGVSRVQLVRGSAALQFGSQFGGMMNYVMKKGDSTKVFSLESEQTIGSYNFFNSYYAVGGTKGKIRYYAYYDNRHGDGWRPNSKFNYKAYYANITYSISKKGDLSFQFSRMDYRQQIAGGLTDEMFNEDPRQSNRERNFFSPAINIPAIIFHYKLSKQTDLEVTANGIWGDRSSVQYINVPNVPDTFNTDINSFNPRQVDRDFYKGFTTEARLLHRYTWGHINGALSAGVRYSNEKTKRRQKGEGTTGSDFTFDLTGPYGVDLRFHTLNYAAFIENVFWLTPKFSVTPGARFEVIQSDLTGLIDQASFPVSYKGNRSFPLAGLGLEYRVDKNGQFYGNISQAYRPFLYAFITPADQVGVVDPDLKDSRGYDIDAGYRGVLLDNINIDANFFYLYYGDRIGKELVNANQSSAYLLTTNIGNSVAKGFEMYADLSLFKLMGYANSTLDIRLFNSLAYTHARYTSGSINNGNENASLEGNRVEDVPDWIERGGIEFHYKDLSSTIQLSHTSNKYNDANNTEYNESGVIGLVPDYTVFDWSVNWTFLNNYFISGGINNIGDKHYFSRRITMYPGPGILPASGRSFYLSVGLHI